MLTDIPFSDYKSAEKQARKMQDRCKGRPYLAAADVPGQAWLVVMRFGQLFVWHTSDCPDEQQGPDFMVLFNAALSGNGEG